ncbi:hypothetical protein E3158_14340 [Escherichia coli O55:H7]|nr:hypothetical protein E3158_14340 [Escherichia coli O55:H7]
MTDLGGKTCIFSHPVYLFLREFSLQDSRGGSNQSGKTRLTEFNQGRLAPFSSLSEISQILKISTKLI